MKAVCALKSGKLRESGSAFMDCSWQAWEEAPMQSFLAGQPSVFTTPWLSLSIWIQISSLARAFHASWTCSLTASNLSLMPRPIENVWKYPRPPALQRCTSRLRIVWQPPANGEQVTIADTTGAYRVLETSHPPTYYLPPADIRMDLLRQSAARRTVCEWKGLATYFDFVPADQTSTLVKARIWSYPEPTPAFKDIKDHLSFYADTGLGKEAGQWKCYVDDDEVRVLGYAKGLSIIYHLL
jgi:uncharacterized protein (DUF427 family)